VALLDRVKKSTVKGEPVPALVDDKLRRGRDRMLEQASERRMCYRFWRGRRDDHYSWVDDKGFLHTSSTTTSVRGGKPQHRVRTTRNLIHPVIEAKVSAASRRTPSYQVAPSTTDPADASAARLAGKVAVYGYDKWGIQRHTKKVVTYALVMGEGFALPYWDSSVGPYSLDPESGELIGAGEVKVRVLGPNQVMWEPGCDFYDSPWHAIEEARPIDQVELIPGFVGGKLAPDATTHEAPTEPKSDQMVMVTEYLERPCPKYPMGRRIICANGRVIAPVENYPGVGPEGTTSDDPVLHRLSYTVDPEQDRDRGLVAHLLDAQRTYEDAWNKILEYKNRTLVPRILWPQSAGVKHNFSDAPGEKVHYTGQVAPQWEQTPGIPSELFQIAEDAKRDIHEMSADQEIPNQVESAKAIQVYLERVEGRSQQFLASVAEFHSRMMRDCLALVAKHYTDPRLLKIKGAMGTEVVPDFKGADLRGQIDVMVFPDSIEAQTKQAQMDKIQWINTNFPGYLKPEAAISAVLGGRAESLIRSFDLDVGRAWKMVQTLKQGPEVVFAVPPQPDGTPGWMPRKQDSMQIHRQIVADFTKSEDYDLLPAETQEAFNLYLDGLDWLEQMQAAQAQAAQIMQAEQLGMANATRPSEKPLPSQPRVQGA
jgi:hypothetical protein